MFVLILIFTIINLLGIEEVGKVSTIFSVIIFIAFMAVTVVGLANWQYNPMEPFYNSEDYTLIGSVGAGLATGMWMYAGYTSMSTLATECKDKSVIPKGLLIIMPLVAISYILPTIAGLASVGQWQDWANDGAGISFGNVLALAGAWGLPCFTIAAVIANLSLFNTQMISISRGFYGMALDNLAPKMLLKVSKKRHVPYIGVLSLSVVTLVLCNFDFSVLVTMDVTMLMVDYVLVFISAARLRRIEPDTPRPFRIPFGDNFVKILIAPGLIIACAALFLNGADYYLGGMIAFISAPILYVVWKRMYGGLYANNPEKYPIDPRTKLVVGDYSRMAIVFGILAAIGLIGGLFWFNYYEVDWESYYGETYPFLGGSDEEITNRIYNSITVVSVIYALIAIVLRIRDVKLKKTETQ